MKTVTLELPASLHADLQALVEQEGGLQVGTTREAVVEQMRKTRQDIFEAEVAHLYGCF